MKTIILFLLFLSTSLFSKSQVQTTLIQDVVYTPTKSSDAKFNYNKAHDYFDKNDYESAIKYYKLAILIDSNFIDAYDNLGLSYRRCNKLDSAELYYLLSSKKYPKGEASVMNLGVVEHFRKNYTKAIYYYDKLIVINPKNPEAYYGLSKIYCDKGDYKLAYKNGIFAEKFYSELNSPYIGDCYYQLCIVCINRNDKKNAKKYLRLAKSQGVEIDNQIENILK
jgi:tetratricopeptide (TPR) repeat protein